MARPRWKGEKAHDPAPRNRNKFPRKRGLPSLPQGHSWGHTQHPVGTTSGMTLVSHHILNPRLPGLPGQGFCLSAGAGRLKLLPRNMHVSKVESVVSCQFKCSNSGRLCGPAPATFWDPTFYAWEGRSESSSPKSEELLEEEVLPRGPSNLPK